ncbi:hypothetical protein HK405_011510 [Cladochytrium tenue]|nr:hypothetical protein HK405_011510 [Cladochytrium tenue]
MLACILASIRVVDDGDSEMLLGGDTAVSSAGNGYGASAAGDGVGNYEHLNVGSRDDVAFRGGLDRLSKANAYRYWPGAAGGSPVSPPLRMENFTTVFDDDPSDPQPPPPPSPLQLSLEQQQHQAARALLSDDEAFFGTSAMFSLNKTYSDALHRQNQLRQSVVDAAAAAVVPASCFASDDEIAVLASLLPTLAALKPPATRVSSAAAASAAAPDTTVDPRALGLGLHHSSLLSSETLTVLQPPPRPQLPPNHIQPLRSPPPSPIRHHRAGSPLQPTGSPPSTSDPLVAVSHHRARGKRGARELSLPPNGRSKRARSSHESAAFRCAGGVDVGIDGPLSPRRLLLDASPDTTLILSSRGIVLFASPGGALGLTPAAARALAGRRLADVCHPRDLVPLMRDLKDATSSGVSAVDQSAGVPSDLAATATAAAVSSTFRFRPPGGANASVEAPPEVRVLVTGRRSVVGSGKPTRCFVLTCRASPATAAPASSAALRDLLAVLAESEAAEAATAAGAKADVVVDSLLARISPQGLVLHVLAPSAPQVLVGLAGPSSAAAAAAGPEALHGVSLADLVHSDDRPALAAALCGVPASDDNDDDNEDDDDSSRELLLTPCGGLPPRSSVHNVRLHVRLGPRATAAAAATLTLVRVRGRGGAVFAHFARCSTKQQQQQEQAAHADSWWMAGARAGAASSCELTRLRLENQRLAAALAALDAGGSIGGGGSSSDKEGIQ